MDAYGTVDETNAVIGMARIQAETTPKIDAILSRIQNDLFDLGSDLATPGTDEGVEFPSLRITTAQVSWLEKVIDQFNDGLQPLTSFVLPGGTSLSAALHMARTVARRGERLVVALREAENDTNAQVVAYLNRLSDLLFVLSRVANANGEKDVLWKPGLHTEGE